MHSSHLHFAFVLQQDLLGHLLHFRSLNILGPYLIFCIGQEVGFYSIVSISVPTDYIFFEFLELSLIILSSHLHRGQCLFPFLWLTMLFIHHLLVMKKNGFLHIYPQKYGCYMFTLQKLLFAHIFNS